MTSSCCHIQKVLRLQPLALVACFALSMQATGCASYDEASSDVDGVVGQSNGLIADNAHTDSIAWAACPIDFGDECAWVALPADHAQPKGDALPIFVSRFNAQSGKSVAQVWLLQGGPGASGSSFREIVRQLLAPMMPDVDFYVLEHRGVGESARLGCASRESPSSQDGEVVTDDEWPACTQELGAQWQDTLADFTTTQDALDLGALIERTRTRDKKVFVFGLSYGTTRALRFLQTHPDLVDGVILDSVVSPGVQFLSQFDTQFDPVAKELATLCTSDPTCGDKLGPDPWGRVIELLAKLDRGHCPGFLYRSLVQQGFTQMLMSRELRPHIFPLTYRLDRCEPRDVAVIEHYFSAISQALSEDTAMDRASPALQIHVALSEMWEVPEPTQGELEQRCSEQILCPGAGRAIGARAAYWPRYPKDEYVDGWPETSTPILAMNGTLDPQTPIGTARATADHLNGAYQRFIEVPWSPHGVVVSSPVKTPGAPPCGVQLAQQFVIDPTAELDTSCIDDLAPPFMLDDAITLQFFGSSEVWDNPAPKDSPDVLVAERPDMTNLAGVYESAFTVWPLAARWLTHP